jgi:hypothetical protein
VGKTVSQRKDQTLEAQLTMAEVRAKEHIRYCGDCGEVMKRTVTFCCFDKLSGMPRFSMQFYCPEQSFWSSNHQPESFGHI